MYRVVKYFEDLQDSRHPYNVGDEFPRSGLEVTKERIDALASSANAQGVPLIEQVEERESSRLDAMSKAELVELAETLDIEVPSSATKAEIRELVEQA